MNFRKMIMLTIVAIIATFTTISSVFTSAVSAASPELNVRNYDINGDGTISVTDYALMKNEIINTYDGTCRFFVSDLVTLKRSILDTDRIFASDLMCSEKNNMLLINNICTDKVPELYSDNSIVEIKCQFATLVFDEVEKLYVPEDDIIIVFYATNVDEPLCICKSNGKYCLSTFKPFAPAIERVNTASLKVNQENTELISNWFDMPGFSTTISEYSDSILFTQSSDNVIHELEFELNVKTDIYANDPCFVCQYDAYIIWTDGTKYYISPELYIGKAIAASKFVCASESNNKLINNVFTNYELIKVDFDKQSLFFESTTACYEFFFNNSDTFNFDNAYIIASAAVKDEPDFIVTILCDGSTYRMTAVR